LIKKEPLELSEEFHYMLNVMEKTDQNLFITGRAGTGKSTLLQLFRNTTRKKTVVLAPTGIAALNVKGQTIHSFFNLPPKIINPDDIKKRKNHYFFKKIEVIIIDEISMVRADLLDSINVFLKVNRDKYAPFGGVQMIFFGDLFQLPPVVASQFEHQFFRTHYESPYFFSAHIFEQGFEIEKFELNKVYRQEEKHFVRLLDGIRTKDIDWDDIEDLNQRYIEDFQGGEYYITLSTRNDTVDQINQKELAKITGASETFYASMTGTFNPKLFPTESSLNLRVGAQVMFIRNDPERKFVNGTIGKVVELDIDKILVVVEKENGSKEMIEVAQQEWEIIQYKLNAYNEPEASVVATFKQYPLKLAWAITIHKSQGKTFDKVIIELGKGAFEFGQTYVALSRCRTLGGIVLKRPIKPNDIMVDERVVEYYESLR